MSLSFQWLFSVECEETMAPVPPQRLSRVANAVQTNMRWKKAIIVAQAVLEQQKARVGGLGKSVVAKTCHHRVLRHTYRSWCKYRAVTF